MTQVQAVPIRVLLVARDEFLRLGVRAAFETTKDITMDEVPHPSLVVQTALTLRPDVIIIDTTLPAPDNPSSVTICRQLLASNPLANVLIWAQDHETQVAALASQAGAKGCIPRSINSHNLITTVRAVAKGHRLDSPVPETRQAFAPPPVTPASQALYARLSPQERRLLPLIAQGLINREIAVTLGLSEKTVKNYLTSLYIKLGISRRTEAVRWYVQVAGGSLSPVPPPPDPC